MNQLLLPYDVVGGSFWLISVGMIGATLFFFFERSKVSVRWHTPMTMIAVVCLMSSIHYFFTKNLWVVSGQAPTLLRYIDWFLNFPMQVLIFYAMLMSVTKVKQGMFWRLLVGTLVFVIAEFLGAAGYMSKTLGFIVGVVGWLYILGELYVGEAGRANARCGNEKIQMAFFANRLILTIGWAIYPIGYFIEHLGGGIDINSVNVVYNLSDFLNKIVFGMIIYKAATEDTRING
jgi:bacteriorhodopsin